MVANIIQHTTRLAVTLRMNYYLPLMPDMNSINQVFKQLEGASAFALPYSTKLKNGRGQ
jgi:hypothetical protein